MNVMLIPVLWIMVNVAKVIQGKSWLTPTRSPVCKYMLGEWCEWSPCTSNNGISIRTRKREVKYPIGYHGPSCDSVWEYEECEMDPEPSLSMLSTMCNDEDWGQWGECKTQKNRKVQRKRVKSISKKSASYFCEDISDYFVEYKDCEEDKCSWQQWSACYNYNPSNDPPKWERYRERPVSSIFCEACDRCGQWTNWESWGDCEVPSSSDCGRIRIRGKIKDDWGNRCEYVQQGSAECTACVSLSTLFRKLTTNPPGEYESTKPVYDISTFSTTSQDHRMFWMR